MAIDRLINSTQGESIINELDNIATKIQGINRDINLASNQVVSMTGYSEPVSTSAIATTDTLNEAVGKLERMADNLQQNKIEASDYATQNTGGTVRIWTTTSGTATTLHISNEAPTP